MAVALDDLRRGRAACGRRAWREAVETLTRAEQMAPLEVCDLEALATAAYMVGDADGYLHRLERAHRLHLDAGATRGAVRCAFWIGLCLLLRGTTSGAAGWFGRAERLLDDRDCVERGYLLIPRILRHVAAGEPATAEALASEAVAIGERFGDGDLVALVMQEQAHALIRQGCVEEGLRLLDETMVAVIADELSPIVTGLVYCNTIAFCQGVFEVGRAREWTGALTQWCEQQPDMVAHTGLCLVHRAEILQLQGSWQDALEEARRAGERLASNQPAAGRARYCEGEIHRLRGELARAEAAYAEASRLGWDSQPGLALLRLAQGDGDAAAAAIRRALSEAREPSVRAALLPAGVEILLAVGDCDQARRASHELAQIAEGRTGLLAALSAQAEAALALADGDDAAALELARHACRAWQQLGAPYDTARARTLVGLACRALGDEDSARLEFAAARALIARLDAAAAPNAHELTARELEVLRLVAAGNSNRQIAAELVISEHTVARHLQNIFAKLRVSSRTAATAFAFEHDLV